MIKEYTLKRANNKGRKFKASHPDFVEFLNIMKKSGIGKAFKFEDDIQDFAAMVYKYVKSPSITIRTDKDGYYTMYAGRVLLIKIRDNRIIKICLPGVKSLKNNYLLADNAMEYTIWAKFPDLVEAGDEFMTYAYDLKHLSVPNVKHFGDNALAYSQLPKFNAPEAESAGDYFLYRTEYMDVFKAPKLTNVGRGCLYENNNALDCSDPKQFADEAYDYEGLFYAPNLANAGKNCHPAIYGAIKKNMAKQR